MRESFGYTTSGDSPVIDLGVRNVDTAIDKVRVRLYHNVGEGWRFIGTVHYDGKVSEP